MCRPKIEVGDIFRQYGDAFKNKYGSVMIREQLRAMKAIQICRTAELGGHIEECEECGAIRISYNSCRNRHCPKCQSIPTERWLSKREADLLPIDYFHIVFTIPDDLYLLIYSNQRAGFGIFFRAVSETLLELTKDKKYLGAIVGIITILHTWGQNLMYHSHIHCLATGGGLSVKNEWKSFRNNYFLPVKVMSRLFRGKLLDYFRKEYNKGTLKFSDGIKDLSMPANFEKFIRNLRNKEWVVYCKPPLKNPETVLEYFGRYTHRVAISNYRIIKLENDKVYFKWKDYKDNNKTKIMALEATEFIRRFLLHILPRKFVKIRYYGLYGNRNRKDKIKFLCELLNKEKIVSDAQCVEEKNWQEIYYELTGINIDICPVCKKGHMKMKEKLLPACALSPPNMRCAA
jgi:hypothetical protein